MQKKNLSNSIVRKNAEIEIDFFKNPLITELYGVYTVYNSVELCENSA